MRGRERASIICGGLALACSIFAVGGSLRWAAAFVAILTSAAWIPMVLSQRATRRWSPLLVLLSLATLLTLVQLLPLPRGWIEALSPTTEALRQEGTELAGVPEWTSITMDVPGTLRGLTFFLTLLGIAVIALRTSVVERGQLLCLGGVAAACGITAGVVGIHELIGASSLYGVYVPDQASPSVLGPLLNGNHLGSLMALGTVISIGLLLYPKQSMAARTVWGLCALGCFVVILGTASRGAVLALLAGLGTTGVVAVGQRLRAPDDPVSGSRRRRFLVSTLPIVVVSACVLVVVIVTSAGSVSEQIARSSLQEIDEPRSKYEAWRSAEVLLEESPWIGVGRGAFEPVFTRVHPASAFVTFSHLENEYIQAVVEWGIPGALALAAALGWFVVVAIRRWREGPLIAGALGGVVAVAVQSNVDFGVELLGLAMPVTIVAATLSHVPLATMEPQVQRRTRVLRVAYFVVLVGAALVLFLPITRSVAEDHIALDNRDVTMTDVEASIHRHPLDYYGYAVGAELLVRARDPKAVGMLNHALRLHPTHPGLHRFAGRLLLARRYTQQASIEYAHALRGTRAPKPLLVEIVRTFPRGAVPDAIPIDYENVGLVVRILEEQGAGDAALVWLDRVIKLRPKATASLELMFALATRRANWAAAEVAARAQFANVATPQTRLALAELLAKRNAHAEAIEVLGDVGSWRGRVENQIAAWFLLCDTHHARGSLDDALRCLRRLDASGLVTANQRPKLTRRLEAVQTARKASILQTPAPRSP